jgi:hypothetical protein
MLIETAIARFGSCADIARVLDGACFPSAVYQWQRKGVVPLWAARKLSDATGGELRIDESLYDAKGRISVPAKKKRKAA